MRFVEHPLVRKGAIESRLYQESIVNTAARKNTLVVLPTGMGKTSVAALVAVHRMQRFPQSRILFLAPTRPLVNQHMKTFEKFLNVGAGDMVMLTGVVAPAERADLYSHRMVFATPQVVENDLRDDAALLEDFSLVIFDEAHRAVGNYAYPFIAKAYVAAARNPLVLALTASPGGSREKIEGICKTLAIEAVEIRTEDDEDVRPWVRQVAVEWMPVELPPEIKAASNMLRKSVGERVKKLQSWRLVNNANVTKKTLLELQKKLHAKINENSTYAFAAVSAVAELLKLEYALEMLETQGVEQACGYLRKLREDAAAGKSRAVKRIAADAGIKDVMAAVESMAGRGVKHPKFGALKDAVAEQLRKDGNAKIIVFSNYRQTAHMIASELGGVEGARPVVFIGQASREGAGLSQREQLERLALFRDGAYNCLVGTSVSEEGLDVPSVDLAIFYEPIPSEIRFIQRRGRVGRQAAGKVIVLMAKDTRDEAYHWSAHHKERKMKSVLRRMGDREGLGKWLQR